LHSPVVRTVADLSAELGLSLSLLLSLLSPEGTLRGRALVELPESAALGWALPSDGVTLGRGLAVALHTPRRTSSSDERALFVQTLPGLSYLPAPASDAAWAQDLIAPAAAERPSDKLPPAIVELVREHLTAPQPVLLSVGGVQGDQLAALAQIARQRQQRPLVMLDGSYVVTDSEGKYSLCGVKPQTHVIKVDRTTLPAGARMLPSSNRNAGVGDSLFVDMKGGELARADFIEGSCSAEVLEQVKARRAQGGVAVPETRVQPQPGGVK